MDSYSNVQARQQEIDNFASFSAIFRRILGTLSTCEVFYVKFSPP